MTAVSLFPRLDPLAVEQCMSKIDEMIADSSHAYVSQRAVAPSSANTVIAQVPR